MGVKALEIYQGSDWFTYRWPVAQAYDTLDRVHDLCLCRSWDRTSSQASEVTEVLSGIGDLCDDLAAELAAVEADLLPFIQNDMTQRWVAFEMRLYLNEIRQKVAQPPLTEPAYFFDQLVLVTARIKDALKHLDQ